VYNTILNYFTFLDPTKYFGCELGAQTQIDYKNDRFVVNGSHDANKLQELLDGFIRKFVLCPSCDNPETDLIVSAKKNTISQGCKACGFHGLLEFSHRLNTYILKNPPSKTINNLINYVVVINLLVAFILMRC
jgi:translation initiation factor 5